ncbi:hypothetical protein DTO027B5_437 [Paecilomyces variotii]|nr:hypothetical protein DTO169C6_3728 [Paecilomyces variotii]KAJ9254742.1 hypothetical protein DTO195F2_6498 [Paecilomyces variotii]KAJ9286444.1 hypothetical protein DTO021C3_5978 [Paecilomyces variotii]KAJ9309580.1 hypothetical protein DTO217A2_870 [Paecilomyces variotii]KAJ9326678.1 hypothetical protein DTO027B3_2339 [Paecilomyces variotii]
MSRAIHAKEIVLFARRSQRRQLSHWPRSTFVPPESNPVHNPAAKSIVTGIPTGLKARSRANLNTRGRFLVTLPGKNTRWGVPDPAMWFYETSIV